MPVCGRCNRAHGGECRLGSNQCFECSQTGHLAHECPSRVQESRGARRSGRTNQRLLGRARMYAVTLGTVGGEAAETQNVGVMAGRGLI